MFFLAHAKTVCHLMPTNHGRRRYENGVDYMSYRYNNTMYNLCIFYTCVSHFSPMFGYMFLHTWGQGGGLNSFFFIKFFLYNLPLVNRTTILHFRSDLR